MKKLTALLLCLVLCLSLAACNSRETASSGNTPAIEAFLESSWEQMDQLTDSFEGSGMEMDLSVQDNWLVYTCRYPLDAGDSEIIKSTLASSTEAFSSTYEAILAALKAEVPSTESVIVEYVDKDGNELFSKEFK